MKRAAVLVDVSSVGGDVDERCLNTEGAEEFGCFGSGGSVGAIDQDPQFAEVGLDTGSERLDVSVTEFDLPGERRARYLQRCVIWRGGILEQGQDLFFNREFAGITELESVAGKNFDAVVGPGIVGGRDDYAGSHSARTREVGDSGSSDDAGAVDVDAHSGQAFRDAIGDPAAGFTGVLPDDS